MSIFKEYLETDAGVAPEVPFEDQSPECPLAGPQFPLTDAQDTLPLAVLISLPMGCGTDARRNSGAELGVSKWGSGIDEVDGPQREMLSAGGTIWFSQLAKAGCSS
jgi:hypothetical protein